MWEGVKQIKTHTNNLKRSNRMSLPLIPGNTFTDPTKTKFHRAQSLGYVNGYTNPTIPPLNNPLTEEELDELSNHKPSLTYGQAVQVKPWSHF